MNLRVLSAIGAYICIGVMTTRAELLCRVARSVCTRERVGCSQPTNSSFQPPSRNRRERAELRPDFFDSAAIIEDDSVSLSYHCLLFI